MEHDFKGTWMRWKEACSGAFFANWDESRASSFIRSILRDKSFGSTIGEGADFKTYALKCGEFEYAVSVQKQDPSKALGFNPEFWRQPKNIKLVRSLTLVPPFQLRCEGDLFIFVTPLGQISRAQISAQELEKICRKELSDANLIYDDVFQMRSLQGEPFLIDLASIRPIDRVG